MESRTNPWLISMFVGALVVVVDILTIGSPLLLGIGGLVTLVSTVVVILQALAARRT